MTRVPPTPLPQLTDDQRTLFAATADVLRSDAYQQAAPDERAAALVELGVPVMLVPDRHGGFGFGPVELAGVAYELGQQAEDTAPLDAAIAAAAVARFGDADRLALLTRLARGDERWTLCVPGHQYPNDAARATRLLLEHGGSLYFAPATQCRFEPQRTVDPGRSIARISYTPRLDDFLTRDASALEFVAAVGACTYAAYLCGLARRMLADAVEYANQREQFGAPIGTFQAVAHKLAEMFVAIDSAVVAAFGSAAGYAGGDAAAPSVARAYCGEAVRRVTVDALQVFGGIGFTEEHHLHRWLKRAKALEATFGAPHQHRALVARNRAQRERLGRPFALDGR
jgi:alkylation response protein AidB-like acyl-CoA dehydrogenase